MTTAPPADPAARYIRIGDVHEAIAAWRGQPRRDVPREVRLLAWLLDQYVRVVAERDEAVAACQRESLATLAVRGWADRALSLAGQALVEAADAGEWLAAAGERACRVIAEARAEGERIAAGESTPAPNSKDVP